MKRKLTQREWMIGAAILVAIGYSSAAVSLQSCDTAARVWLPKNVPTGAQSIKRYAEPAELFLPFSATVSFEKEFHPSLLATNVVHIERGTRYYLAFFGLVFPLWTSSDTDTYAFTRIAR
jgi:hypothetical protein